MTFRYCADNAILAAAATPAASDALAMHPGRNLASGDPSLPTVWPAETAISVDFDLDQVRNGNGETAFVGGLPAAGWAKSDGATVVRNTTVPRTGFGCIEVQGTGQYAWFDIRARAGQRFTLVAACRLTSGSGRAGCYVRDLGSGRWLHGNEGVPSWGTNATTPLLELHTAQAFVEASGTAYAALSGTFDVQDADVIGGYLTTLRIYTAVLSGTAGLYDDIAIWPGVNFVSVHGHNLRPASWPLELRAGDTFPPTVARAQLEPTGDSAYEALDAIVTARYWRAVSGPIPGGHAALGTMVLGQASTELDDPPRYPIKVRELLLQQRSGEPGRPGQSAVLARAPVRGIQFDVRHMSDAGRAQLAALLELCRYGADPVVLVLPLYDVDTAVYGRLLDVGGYQGSQGMFGFADSTITLQEAPSFNLVP